MDDNEITRLVERYLDSMPDDEVLAIMGVGSFTRRELEEHFNHRTAVGERFANMALSETSATE